MAHECTSSGMTCKELPDGSYLLSLESQGSTAVNLMVNFCPHCGSAAPQPATQYQPPPA